MTTDSFPQKPSVLKKKKTLLEKYEIPLSHLDFEYIKRCCNILEVERIVRILRSGEEGNYPELLQCAENRLKFLCPDHKTLRSSELVLNKHRLDPEEWESVQKEIMDWKTQISDTDSTLSASKSSDDSMTMYPSIRRPIKNIDNETKKEPTGQEKKTCVTDYNQWEKFDADKECLKLDLEEEKRAEEKLREELAEKRKNEIERTVSLEEKEFQIIDEMAEDFTSEEKKIMAAKEKELGNEFYKRNLYSDAIKHYTKSIRLHPSAVAYNNRAATYLKECQFSKALGDLNIVLNMEPDNVKAHFRRALALQHKNEFQMALDDILFVLKHQPKHTIARHIANELRQNCCKLPKIHRLKIKDEKEPKKITYKEVSDEEFKKNYRDKDFLEVSSHGLPKIMCNCNGRHVHDSQVCTNDTIRYQHIKEKYGKNSKDKIAEMERASKMLKGASGPKSTSTYKPLVQHFDSSRNKKFSTSGARRLDIVELEKILEEDVTSKIQETDFNGVLERPSQSFPAITVQLPTEIFWDDAISPNTSPCKEDENEDTKQEEARSITYNGGLIPKTKEEKMNLNINLMMKMKDAGAGGDAESVESMSVDGELSRSVSSNSMYQDQNDSSQELFEDDLNLSVGNNTEIEAIAKEIFSEDVPVKCECGDGYIVWGWMFDYKWQSYKTELNAQEMQNKLLRLLCPHQLPKVVTNTLNEESLTSFIDYLNEYYDSAKNAQKVRDYLLAISKLQRFKIIYCFISKNTKLSVKKLLEKVGPVPAEIEKAYL